MARFAIAGDDLLAGPAAVGFFDPAFFATLSPHVQAQRDVTGDAAIATPTKNSNRWM